MNNEQCGNSEMMNLIDRLVCGEIEETARGQLLAWLEADHTRWRSCGLAFLESQTWSQALATWPQTGDASIALTEISRDEVNPPHAGYTPARSVSEGAASRERERPVRSSRLGYLAALAASVIVAFGLGVLSRGALLGSSPSAVPITGDRIGATEDSQLGPEKSHATGIASKPPASNDPVLASFTAHPNLGPAAETIFQFPVVPTSDGTASQPTDVSPIVPEYVRAQWERRGFAVETRLRFLFAKLPNGQRVVVPVQNVQLNELPIKVY